MSWLEGDKVTIIKGPAFELDGEVRAVVRKGKTVWLGVEFDEALEEGIGNDGKAKDGIRYFSCEPNCGLYVRCTDVRHWRPKTQEEMTEVLNS